MNNSEKSVIDKRSLTIQEQAAVSKTKKRGVVSTPIYQISENGGLDLFFDGQLKHDDAIALLNSRIMEATGAENSAVGLELIAHAEMAMTSTKTTGKERINRLNLLAQTMRALSPQDECEGQLVSQLIVLHEHAMNLLGKALRTERVDFANVHLNGASKLLARHHETLDALLKYRRKGEQRVHVEHVHVHNGGQAIVGNVMTGSGLNQKK